MIHLEKHPEMFRNGGQFELFRNKSLVSKQPISLEATDPFLLNPLPRQHVLGE
jgi:hypothetical protein